MVFISSVGRGIPKYDVSQNEIKQFVKKIYANQNRRLQRYLPVFDHAKINNRQLVAPLDWYAKRHSFSEANEVYIKHALDLSLQAIDECVENLSQKQAQLSTLSYEAIDLIVFVSSTGIATPSLDAHIVNARPFREDIVRMPLWGLGCAGGAMGLARARDWLQANQDKTALVICCELCSLTFQLEDNSTSNIVGTALFGDGVAATLLIGENSHYSHYIPNKSLKIEQTHSYMKKDTLDVMGWDMKEGGLHVIFSKKIPSFIETVWKKHVQILLKQNDLTWEQIASFIAHPGGRKVLEEMEKACHIPIKKLFYSYDVLQNHGNISSATVMYVLKKWLDEEKTNELEHPYALLSALGPGFSSELLLLKRVNK